MNSSIKSLCRICLGEGATIPIFEDFLNEDGSNHNIQHKLTLCLNAKFEDVPGYPLCICSFCHKTLDEMFDFVNKFKETCKVLEERVKVGVKQESIDYEDHDDFVYPEDENTFDVFKSDLIKKEIKVKIEDSACLIENIIELSGQKAIVKKKMRKVMTNEKAANRKPKNKVCKLKINKRELLSDREDKNCCMPNPPKAENNPSYTVLCESCGETFRSREKLKLHEDKTHKNIKLICPTCSRTFTAQIYLTRHIKRRHSDAKDFICSECGKGFAFVSDLNLHSKAVHQKILRKKVYKRWLCKLCDKDFITKTLLIIHERSAHTGERPAVCTVCNKSFFHEDYLKQHMFLHTGERPFECPVCGRGYAQRGNMKSHMRNHRISELDKETLSKIKTSWHRFMKP